MYCEDVEHWIEYITQHSVNLTEWEEKFVDSMAEKWDDGQREFSERQLKILERIYSERTP